jgi:glutathione-regulated potassium-efflux system ancillary protein KefG
MARRRAAMTANSRRPGFAAATTTTGTPSVLVLLAHPVRDRSRVNRVLVDAIRPIPGVTVHDLYEAYPDFLIDVAAEKALLLAHHTIVMQHPFYWYSTPAILKEWQDQVLEFGWAYGRGGDKLRGKRLLTAITTGGPATSYQADGLHHITIPALLAPIAQTARLCGMVYLEPFIVHGTHRLDDAGIADAARRYKQHIEALCVPPGDK